MNEDDDKTLIKITTPQKTKSLEKKFDLKHRPLLRKMDMTWSIKEKEDQVEVTYHFKAKFSWYIPYHMVKSHVKETFKTLKKSLTL